MAKATADREHRRVIRAQNAITAALRKQSKKWFGISGVIGFAVGGTYPDLTATFILDGNLSATKRKKVQKQLPRFIKLKTKRVPTEFAALGTVKLTADIGDPTANRVDYV